MLLTENDIFVSCVEFKSTVPKRSRDITCIYYPESLGLSKDKCYHKNRISYCPRGCSLCTEATDV